MSTALWVDATHGAAGDMLLGALLDAGAPLEPVLAALAALAAAGTEPIGLAVEQVRRHGLRALLAVVATPPSHVHRGPADVHDLVVAAGLTDAARDFALAVFDALAEAEAHVHGTDVAQVHFHEVGALDSLADVIGCAVALDSLGLLVPGAVRVVSTVALGGGTAWADHGRIPVPVPATLELLARVGAPVSAGPGDRELCTPTGAALLACLATGWGALPGLTVHAVGSGAGTFDPVDRPNLVRAVVGDPVVSGAPDVNGGVSSVAGVSSAPGAAGPPAGQSWREDRVLVLEATVDDLDPRLWPDVLDDLHTAGSFDAWLTPVLMRHGRPGHVVTALTAGDTLDAVFRALVTTTTTLGARVHAVDRRALHRDRVTVQVDGLQVGVKRGLLDGRPVTVQPEYAEARNAARTLGLPVADVLTRARSAAAHADPTPPDLGHPPPS